jgi:hypothetical protein
MDLLIRHRFWPLGCWDRGFESCSGHGCSPLGSYVVLSCVGRGHCHELITRPKESYHVYNKIRKPKNGGKDPAWAVKATDYDDYIDLLMFILLGKVKCIVQLSRYKPSRR